MTAREYFEQASIKANDKVVCIDDAYQRLDLYDAPDGLLRRGQVHCVTGASECGGLLLAGLRAISSRTGKEVGFHASRFCKVEQFREIFPNGVPDTADDLDCSNDDEEIKEPITLPTIDGLVEPRPCVIQAIEVLEMIYAERWHEKDDPPWLKSGFWPEDSAGAVREGLLTLCRSPRLAAYMNQSFLLWNRLIRNNTPTVLFCRNHSPVSFTVFQMCVSGGISGKRIFRGDIEECDFTMLTVAAGRLSNAPVRLCDAQDPDTFLKMLFDAHTTFDYALCDWVMEGEEAAAACRMTRNSKIVFSCPQ